MQSFTPIDVARHPLDYNKPYLNITMTIFLNNFALNIPPVETKGILPHKIISDERKVSVETQNEEFAKDEISHRTFQQTEDEPDLLFNHRDSCFEFLFAFIFADNQDYEKKVMSIPLLESDMNFIKGFLKKRVVSLKIKGAIDYRLNSKCHKSFIDNSIVLREKIYYQRNSNCLRAVFRKIIEFMKQKATCPPNFVLPTNDKLKSENYVQIVSDLGVAPSFLETIHSPSFRSYLLSNSENCFRANFKKWEKTLLSNPDADIRMGIYPADLDRALQDLESMFSKK